MKTIALLMHKAADGEVPYVIWAIAEQWRQRGYRVVPVYGTKAPVDADLAILHVDATFTPPAYQKFLKRFPLVLNGSVTDISKRFISRQAVLQSDGYQGPVLVKTNLNSQGNPERKRSPWRRLWHRFRRKAGLKDNWRGKSLADYHVFDHKDQVPARVWKNPHLFVERFLPERDGEFYCLRTWIFLGDREAASLVYSRTPIVKGRTVVKREKLESVPDDLRALRRELGFDYGKFDFVVIDGKTVLYDVNRTPAVGGVPPEVILPMVEALAQGIHAYEPLG